MKTIHFLSTLCLASSPAMAQGISLQVVRTGDTVSFNVTGAAPSGFVSLALDPMGCDKDVTADRMVTAADVAATQANYGPCTTFAKRRYDQNNDGYVNSADRDLVQAQLGCSNPESFQVPGCSITADLDPSNSLLYWIATSSSGAGTQSITMPAGLNLPLYVQAIDLTGCQKTPLASYRFTHSVLEAQPNSSVSVVVRSDFAQPIANGLVGITTDQTALVVRKTAVGQTARLADASPLTEALLTLGETPCSFSEFGTTRTGVALGMLNFAQLSGLAQSEALTQFAYQPVAFDVKFGNDEVIAPFNGLWELVPPAQGTSYDAFFGQMCALTTNHEISTVLEYYGVPGSAAEQAPAAMFLRIPNDVDLDSGTTNHNGFGLAVQNFAGIAGTPHIATRHLYADKADDVGPQITATAINAKSMMLSVHGKLAAGDYIILIDDSPFVTPHAAFPSAPPDLIESPGVDDGPGPCPVGGTPPPPDNPPAVGGAPCQAGMGVLWSLSDCVLTDTYTTVGPTCYTFGPLLASTGSYAGGATLEKGTTVTHKGSASVTVEVGGVSATVGTEVEHSETTTTTYTVPAGNGQNVAFYLYVKMCLTTYQIKYHTWEFPYPWPVCWCCECCINVDAWCEAGASMAFEVCNR